MWLGLGIRITNWWRTALAASGPFNNHPTLTDGLVSVWPLSEDGFDVAPDAPHDLTNNNVVTFVAKGVGAPANMPDTVANFVAASSQYFNAAANITNWQADWTVALWYRSENAAANEPISVDGNLRFYLNVNQWSWYLNGFPEAFQITDLNAWHLILFTKEDQGGGVHHYGISYDGAALVIDNFETQLSTNGANFFVGKYFGGDFNFIDGQISNPMVWSRAISSDECADLWAAGDGLFY